MSVRRTYRFDVVIAVEFEIPLEQMNRGNEQNAALEIADAVYDAALEATYTMPSSGYDAQWMFLHVQATDASES